MTPVLEMPLFFDAGAETLFGIVSAPAAAAQRPAVVMLSGGGATAPATNRNRLSVHMGRRLADAGHSAMRFDYHGIGESTGVLAGAPRVDEPYLDDIDGAIRCLRENGAERFILVGACFGGRTALAYAPQLDKLDALVLISPPLRDLGLDDEAGTRLALTLDTKETLRRAARLRTIGGLFDPVRRRAYGRFISVKTAAAARRLGRALTRRRGVDDAWLGRDFLEPIERLAQRGVPVLFIFGTEDHHYHDFQLARPGRLGKVLQNAPRTEIVVVDGWVHGLTQVEIQNRVIDLVCTWIEQRTADGGATA